MDKKHIARMVQTETALLPAPFWCTYAWNRPTSTGGWRERPALALLAWEALARDPPARLRRIQVESIGTTINFRPATITNRDIAAWGIADQGSPSPSSVRSFSAHLQLFQPDFFQDYL
jgi:hypothetical protein